MKCARSQSLLAGWTSLTATDENSRTIAVDNSSTLTTLANAFSGPSKAVRPGVVKNCNANAAYASSTISSVNN